MIQIDTWQQGEFFLEGFLDMIHAASRNTPYSHLGMSEGRTFSSSKKKPDDWDGFEGVAALDNHIRTFLPSEFNYRTETWVNILYYAGSIGKHTHHFAEYAANYYVQSAGASGALVFPGRLYIRPVPGTFVLFEGKDEHYVQKNRAKYERISISLNYHQI